MDECNCAICNNKASKQIDHDKDLVFFHCEVCGRYQLNPFNNKPRDYNKMASYLIYHKYSETFDRRYNTELSKEECDKYKEIYEKGEPQHRGIPVHMDANLINTWYPRTFSEKIDNIMLLFNSRMKHLGQKIEISTNEMPSILFMDRVEKVNELTKDISWRDIGDVLEECDFMLDCMKEAGYINYESAISVDDSYEIQITAQGFQRIDELQRNTANGKNVLVAMKFGDDTISLREAIRKGIQDAGYIANYIDEVPHNDFITPELLKKIRDSKFVVVDLSHQNNEAYFEEGYAMGLGKPVIQLCKRNVQLHFDIAQKNTIMWDTEDDIPEILTNRIKATID